MNINIIKLFKTLLILMLPLFISIFIPYCVGILIEYVLPSSGITTGIYHWGVGFIVLSFIGLSILIGWMIYTILD